MSIHTSIRPTLSRKAEWSICTLAVLKDKVQNELLPGITWEFGEHAQECLDGMVEGKWEAVGLPASLPACQPAALASRIWTKKL